jgi:hypothetical protein
MFTVGGYSSVEFVLTMQINLSLWIWTTLYETAAGLSTVT